MVTFEGAKGDSRVWNYSGVLTPLLFFRTEDHLEFANQNENQLISTSEAGAAIWDIRKNKLIRRLTPSPKYLNSRENKQARLTTGPIYHSRQLNKARLDPSDNLVISDGILWDQRRKREIHTFPNHGIFHPNGLEVLSSSEVSYLIYF